jgi:hypothetical protein
MTTQTIAQLIEELNKARDTIREVKTKLNGLQPDPMVGDVWKSKDGLFVIFRNDRTNGNVKAYFLVNFTETSIGLDQLKENYIMVGRAANLVLPCPGDTGPIEQDKDLPKFRPFTKADWDMFAGATCFTARKGSTTELITPHIKELDWALVVVDKSGIEIYPSCDLTHGDPEYWMVNWKEVDLPRMREIDQMDARDAIEVCESLMCEINSYMDLKQQDGFRKVS